MYIYTYMYTYIAHQTKKVMSACRSLQGAQSPQPRNVPRNVYGQPQRLVYIYIDGKPQQNNIPPSHQRRSYTISIHIRIRICIRI